MDQFLSPADLILSNNRPHLSSIYTELCSKASNPPSLTTYNTTWWLSAPWTHGTMVHQGFLRQWTIIFYRQDWKPKYLHVPSQYWKGDNWRIKCVWSPLANMYWLAMSVLAGLFWAEVQAEQKKAWAPCLEFGVQWDSFVMLISPLGWHHTGTLGGGQ